MNIGTKNLHEYIDDRVSNLLTEGSNITLDYNDSGGTLEISSSGGMSSGLTAEEVRDTIATFAVAGENITIEHRDADNQLIFNADASLDTLGTVIIADTNGALILLNRADSSRSVTLGNLASLSNQFSSGDNLNGLTYHEGILYAVARGTRRVFSIDLHTSPISVTTVGTLPSTLSNIGGMTSHNGTVYIARSGSGAQALWSGDIETPSGYTRVGYFASGDLENIGGLASHGGKLYGINASATSRGLFEIDVTDPSNSTSLGTMPSAAGAQFGMFSVSGNLYTVSDVGGTTDEWWQVDLADISNSYRVGTFPSTNVGGAAVAEGIITTTVIPEGVNLYFTDARVEALVESWAHEGDTSLIPSAKLPTSMGGTTVEANPGGTLSSQLKSVTIDSTDYQVRSTFAVTNLSNRPLASAATRGHLYHVLQNRTAYIGVDENHVATAPEGTFANIPNRSDLHIVTTLPTGTALNNASTGDFYFHNGGSAQHGGFEFYEVITHGSAKRLQNVTPLDALSASVSTNGWGVVWLGAEPNDNAALEFTYSLSSATDYFYINTGTNNIERLNRSTYSGPGTTAHNYRWLAVGGGGDQTAAEVTVDTTDFSQNLTSADSTVQAALETIDSFSQYQGAWQQASWPAGVIVTRSGIAYISLVNNNTQIPTSASTQWSGLPEGFTYRGDAPTAATNYNYGHLVFDPDTDNVYVFTSTVSASVTRANIPTHANFVPLVNVLTNAEATSSTSDVYGSVSGSQIADAIDAYDGGDTKVVTALPDPADAADADKDKLWLVVPTADEGTVEVAHFEPVEDTEIFALTAGDHTYGSGLHIIGANRVDRIGHLSPSTNLHDVQWFEDGSESRYYIEFKDGDTTPFDYTSYTNGLSLYFREQGTTGNWRRVFLAQLSDDNEFESADGVANHFVKSTTYDVIIRRAATAAGVTTVASVPSTLRLEPHPGGGSFRSFVDEDDLGHISVVVQENREVDGEVDGAALDLSGVNLTLTIERTIGADLTSTVALPPAGLPLTGGTLTGNLIIDPGNVAGPTLQIEKGDTSGNPVVRMIHPDNTGNGQRPFNARRDGESDYFEVNGRLGGTSAQPGIAIGSGGGVRDCRLYRDEADVWRTPDAFHVGELRVDTAGRSDSRTQLGLGTAAIEDTGTASGDLALLGTGGEFDEDRIPDLPSSKITGLGSIATNNLVRVATEADVPSSPGSRHFRIGGLSPKGGYMPISLTGITAPLNSAEAGWKLLILSELLYHQMMEGAATGDIGTAALKYQIVIMTLLLAQERFV